MTVQTYWSRGWTGRPGTAATTSKDCTCFTAGSCLLLLLLSPAANRDSCSVALDRPGRRGSNPEPLFSSASWKSSLKAPYSAMGSKFDIADAIRLSLAAVWAESFCSSATVLVRGRRFSAATVWFSAGAASGCGAVTEVRPSVSGGSWMPSPVESIGRLAAVVCIGLTRPFAMSLPASGEAPLNPLPGALAPVPRDPNWSWLA